MATTMLRLRPPAAGRPAPAAGPAIAVVLCLALAAATLVAGPTMGAAAVGGGVALLVLLSHARLAVTVALVALLVCEGNESFGIPAMTQLYEQRLAVLTPFELLELTALAAVLLDAVRRRQPPRLPVVLVPLLALAAAAFWFGYVNGRTSERVLGYAQTSALQTMAPLFIVPFLVVNVVRDRADLRRWITVGLALVVAKALLGLFVVASGLAFADPGDPVITYYEPAANLLIVAFLLLALLAGLGGVQLDRWVWIALPLVIACFVLSYRRSFWVGFVLAFLIMLPVGAGYTGRRLLVPVLAIAAIGGFVIFQAGLLNGISGSVVERVESINARKVTTNNQDRYRIAERRNVLAELEASPLTGIGVGVPWRQQKPLNFEYPDGRLFVHMAALWWWLKMGLLGLLAYVAVMLFAIVLAVRVWRAHDDPLVRTAALAVGGTFVTLVPVDLASTVLGPDERGTTVLALLLGLLAVMHADTPAQRARMAAR